MPNQCPHCEGWGTVPGPDRKTYIPCPVCRPAEEQPECQTLTPAQYEN